MGYGHTGLTFRALRAAIRERKIEKADREQRQMMLDLYMEVLGE
jgi:uncharacterized protein (UPF0335 family)